MTPSAYLSRGKVHGWLSRVAGDMLIALAPHLDLEGRPVAEIGVHHGKFLILLALLTRGRAVGFDLFERQEENVDGSGLGDRARFLENCRRYLGEGAPVEAVTANSLELDAAQVIGRCGAPPVIVSVDGGHTAELTANDLAIAAEAVAEDGVVVLDDTFNEMWPDVSVGLADFMRARPGVLVPFAIGGNKVLFARSPERARALRVVLARLDLFETRSLRLRYHQTYFGAEVVILRPCDRIGNWALFRRNPVWQAAKRTDTFRRVRAMLGRD